MATVNQRDAIEVEPHKFVTEASDIGLRVGEWPERIATDLGNKQSFVRSHERLNDEGDLLVVVYRQELGCIELHVLND